MKELLLTEQEAKRILTLSESEMLAESSNWTPSQWAVYLTKGEMFDDQELDRFIEEEIIER